MEFKHDRRTNTAYIKTVDLQLNGEQINLSERPNSKDQVIARKKLVRSLRPCTLRRPMSATPSFGYRDGQKVKRMPPWSRPQSAGGSSSLRRNKLAAKFSQSTLHDPDYCAEFGATYTLSSSQLLHSLMGSCSINEGLDSDTTPTPSPQPTLGDTIRVAAQLEPGLTAKPPLPPTPTPTPQQRPEPPTEDDIIALKFQRWFPDAILESEIIRQASIVERQMDETDQSDGTSLTDRTTFSDKQTNEKPSTSNISTFVKKRRIPKSSTSEDSKKSIVKFSENKVEDGEGIHGMKSPKIVVHEVDPYGCDLVTEEFVSESNIRCLTPDYISSLKHSSLGKDKNNKCLSLSDLNVNMSHSVTKSHSVSVYSDSEMYKDVERNLKSSMSDKSGKGYSNHEIYQNDEQYVKTAVSEYTDKIYEDDKPNSKAAGLKKPENSMSRELYKDDECNIKSTASEKSGKRYSNHKIHKDNEQYVKTVVSEYSDNKYLDHEMYEEDIPSNKPTGSKKIERSLNLELNTDERSISSMSGKYGKGHSYHEMNGEEEEHNVKSERFHKEYSGRGVCKDDKHIDNPVLSKRIHRGYSDSEMCKSGKQNVKSKLSESSCISDSELYKDIERSNRKSLRRSSDPRYEIGSPENFETSASKYRHTSTPIGNASNKQSSDVNIEVKDETSVTNKVIAVDNGLHGSMLKHCNNIEVKHAEHFQNYNSLSPPIRLRSEEEELYRDHLSSLRSLVEKDQKVKTFRLTEVDSEDRNDCDNQGKDETKIQEKHAHFTNESKPFNRSAEVKRNHETVNSTEKCLDERKQSYAQPERNNFSTMKEKGDTNYPPKVRIRHGSLENVNKDIGCKSNKPVKEIYRAASVPPYPNTKPAAPLSKHAPSQDGPSDSQNSKRKVRRSMSYDEASIPELSEKDSGVSSYEDIVTMIKVLEREDLQSPIIKYKATPPPIESLIPEQSSSAKAILNFLDEVERGSVTVVETDRSLATAVDTSSTVSKDPPVSSRLGSLLTTDTADLAQQVMTLSLQLEESLALSKALEERYRQSVELLRQQKTESDEIDSRRQKFIDQLLKEKRLLAVQYETALREMEGKHETAMKVIEERHKVEMRKAQEKFNAAEKIRRDKWIDTKTKKIKELTVRGLEPELERMAASHQEELAELRRVHQRQMTEAENAWARRTAALREQEANERQAAIQHEREAARHRMEQELGEIEKSYQEQRRRLMEEVRQEKDLLQRQSERLIAEKQVELARQLDEAKKKLQTKLAGYDKQHEEELAKLKECLETEKQAWISRQKGSLEEREAVLREELKRERDKHIELVIRRLESEAAAKEQAIENKLKRLKESYDAEVNDLDSTLKELRARLKETRSELQKSEDNNAALKAQISQAHNELLPLKQTIDKLRKDYNEAKQQSESKIAELQREISETKQAFQEQVTKIHNEKEKQLQQVYTRVKEAISKKEEALTLVSKQRDLALEQCSQLEKMLEAKRNHSLKHL